MKHIKPDVIEKIIIKEFSKYIVNSPIIKTALLYNDVIPKLNPTTRAKIPIIFHCMDLFICLLVLVSRKT